MSAALVVVILGALAAVILAAIVLLLWNVRDRVAALERKARPIGIGGQGMPQTGAPPADVPQPPPPRVRA